MGGILFGGPMGALAAGVTSLFEEASGDSIGDYLASLVDDVFGGKEDVPENSAQNAPRDEKKGRNLGRSVTRSASRSSRSEQNYAESGRRARRRPEQQCCGPGAAGWKSVRWRVSAG